MIDDLCYPRIIQPLQAVILLVVLLHAEVFYIWSPKMTDMNTKIIMSFTIIQLKCSCFSFGSKSATRHKIIRILLAVESDGEGHLLGVN